MISYKNIGLLDLRKGTPEALANIQSMTNIGTLLLREGQVSQIGHIRQVNVGSVFTLPEDQEVALVQQNGDFEIDNAFLEGVPGQVLLIVNGNLKIKADVAVQGFESVFRAVVNGNAQVPNRLKAAFAIKCEVNGEVMYFDPGDVLVQTPLVLSADSLWSFAPGSVVRVERLVAVQPIPAQTLTETFSAFKVKSVVATQEMLRALAPLVADYHQVEKHLVPEDYTYFDALDLNESSLKTLKADKLYVSGKLTIKELGDQWETELGKVQAIICGSCAVKEHYVDAVNKRIVRAGNFKVLAKCSRENYGKLNLTAAYLESVTDLVLGNYGKLAIQEDVTPELFATAVKRIENYGKITCSKALYPAVMATVHSNYGVVRALESASEPGSASGNGEGDDRDRDAQGWEADTEIVNLESFRL